MKNPPIKKEGEFNEPAEINSSPAALPVQTQPIQHTKIVDKNDDTKSLENNDNQQSKQIPAHEKEQPIKISLD